VDLGIEGYAFPEESLDKLKGEVAYGNWKLEVWDKRVGATNPTPTLQAWKMSFVLDNTVPLINTNNTTAAFNPTLPAQTNRAVDELVPLTITNTATPAFLTNTLTYTLVNPPAGAAISTNGVITWTPSEIQGYGTWNFTTIVTDDQSPAGRATNSFTVTVNEVNVAPVLPEILVVTNYFVTPGTFTFFDPAVDSDYPANDLTYTLLNAPTNAIIDANGLITWTPGTNDAPSTNLFRIVVTDFSPFALTNQHLSATNFFYLVVGVGSNAPTFSLMQYNVKGNGAPDWTTNATQVAAIGREIRYLQPDVITFNEIPVAFAYEMTNWAKDFLSGYNVSVSAGHDVAIGNAIATKFAVSTRSSLHGTSLVPYGYNGTFTRDLFEAIVTVPGFAHPVHFFSAHLKSSASGYADAALKRAAEAAAITNFFTTNLFAVFPNDYYVLSGDMNEADTNTLAIQTLLTNTGLKMTAPVNPYSGSLNTFSIQSPPPSSRIDYIFPCGALASNILSSQVFRTDLVAPTPTNFNAGDDALASDHLPVLMTFRDPTFVASNLAPVFVTTPQSTNVAPLTTFTATNLATDSDLPPQTITYSLVNPPTGMTIDSATAVILWTPAANQLGTFTIGTVATDNGSPARSATNYFQLFVVDFANIATNIVAFPGAEGAGAFAVGGRGGSVYHVTSLINDGPGSLRFGLRTPNRTIVFDISGTIELTSDLKINRSYLTIAGQTAPGEGITLSRRLTSVQDNHDVQIRFIRCRPGDYYGTNFQNDSFHFDKVTNSIADHVSASWSIDETLSCTESRDITVQWSMITDSLNNSFHDKGPHGYGSLIRYGDGKITYHHNLYADHNSRNPRLGDNLTLDFVNNVIYNWGNLPGYSGDDATDILDNPLGFTNRLNYVGNYAVAGSNSSQRVSAFVGYTTNTWVYSASNRIDSALDGALNGTNSDFGLISGLFTPSAVPFALLPPAVTTEAAATAYERVMSFAGASRVRDTVDQNILNKVINQTGVIIDSQTQVGGWPLLNSLTPAPDTDQDGMPNYWETTLGLTDPNNGSDGPLNSGNGYTYLENYLNWLAAPHALVLHDTFVDVDLKLLAGNTVAQGFGVSGASNGVVVLQGDGHTARFTPTTNFTGFAAFNLNVTNLVTGGGFGPVPVSVLVSAISFPTNTTTVTNPPVIISSTSFNSTNGFTLNWTAPVTSQFQVQWTTNLIPVISWTSFTNILTSGSGNFTFTDDGSQSGGFTAPHYYRLLTLP
jgi:endonuclease/exonuclease/phosphatase family metal-dependent hydrolase